MSGKPNRREAIAAYKERKPTPGVFVIRCTHTQGVWVGASENLGASRNALWFGLGIGRQRNPTLQQAWNDHGEATITFEILDRIDPDDEPVGLVDELRRRQRAWATQLGAEIILR